MTSLDVWHDWINEAKTFLNEAETTEETTEEEVVEVAEEETDGKADESSDDDEDVEDFEEEDDVEDAEAPYVKEAREEAVETAHDDFDWSVDKRNVTTYSKAEKAEMEETYTAALNSLEENTVVKGTVVSINKADVVLNVGFKSDGMVSTSEFRDMEDLKVGDEVDVYVVNTENQRGQLELSRKKAKLLTAWTSIKNAYENDEIVKGKIITKTKGGLIANVFGLETFLPGSQIDVKPIVDYDAFVGKIMEFKVVKINEAIKNAVVSHKALIESDIEEQRLEIISQLEKGQVLEGV
ncbi:MAG: S1 RNA-binding domain-containing protein, partial [Bacteroidetes bacterium]|nr:S1 RNA-binding domain-containing protein [Bacteroidota bacterium]